MSELTDSLTVAVIIALFVDHQTGVVGDQWGDDRVRGVVEGGRVSRDEVALVPRAAAVPVPLALRRVRTRVVEVCG